MELLKVEVGGDIVEPDVPAGGADGDLGTVAHVHGVRDPHLEAAFLGAGLPLVGGDGVGPLEGHVGVPHAHGALL